MGDRWYIQTRKGVQGSFSSSRISRFAAQGRLRPDMRLSPDREVWSHPEAFGFHIQAPSADTIEIGESGFQVALDSSDDDVAVASATDSGEYEQRRASRAPSSARLRTPRGSHRVTCPHCLEKVSLGDVLWISPHEQLRGDPLLGDDAWCRFSPTRFNRVGKALDAFGYPCDRLACPKCRLELPQALVGSSKAIFSIIGAPSSGKSYFLGAMTWQLRRQLPSCFGLVFQDVDPEANRIVHLYEHLLFCQDGKDRLVALPKTQTTGDLYRTIQCGEQPITLPRPFMFSLRSQNGAQEAGSSHVLVLYDNAGEHFYPGQDPRLTATRHLARSSVLFFLFDPLQDPRFRHLLSGAEDPQLAQGIASQHRQETILLEATARIRRELNLPLEARYEQPLVIVVTKCDVWGHLLGCDFEREPWVQPPSGGPAVFRRRQVRSLSKELRTLLLGTIPELVSAAESFSERVRYIPVSALGTSPLVGPDGGLAVRAGSIQPRWVTVPILYSLSQWSTGLIASREEDAA